MQEKDQFYYHCHVRQVRGATVTLLLFLQEDNTSPHREKMSVVISNVIRGPESVNMIHGSCILPIR